jgi:hypothetical protein
LSESLAQVASYLGGLAVYLRNLGAEVPEPSLDRYEGGEIGFAITAELPGPGDPKPAVMTVQEIWNPTGAGRYERAEYAYDLIDYPANRRRAFHMHDVPAGRGNGRSSASRSSGRRPGTLPAMLIK